MNRKLDQKTKRRNEKFRMVRSMAEECLIVKSEDKIIPSNELKNERNQRSELIKQYKKWTNEQTKKHNYVNGKLMAGEE